MTMKFNRIDAVFCVLSDHSDLFQNMIQNMICRILLGAPRLCGSHHSVRHIGLATGTASAARAAAASHRSMYVAASEREGSAHTWAAAAGCSSSCQSQLQSTLLMTVTVTIHSSLKNAPHSPTQRVTLNYAPQTLSSAIPEPSSAQNIGVAG